jgi:hypothetical protein
MHNLKKQRDEAIRERDEARAWARRFFGVALFYGHPDTYFAIGFFPDPPCGQFMDDFSNTELGFKPGKNAREALLIPPTPTADSGNEHTVNDDDDRRRSDDSR